MNVGIIGYGKMGEQLSHHLCSLDHIDKIYLKLGKKKLFNKDIALKKIKINCRLIKKTFDKEMVNKIILVENYKEFNNCFVVIETVIENLKIKSDILKDLSKELNSNVIISSNTSSLTLKQLIDNIKYPNRFCCIHFFNPLWSTNFVEFIINDKFEVKMKKDLINFIKLIKKEIIYTKDVNGFAVNRILIPMINEAFKLVEEGIIEREDLDKIFEKNIGMKMGPLRLSNFIGKHTVLSIIKNLYRDEDIIKISETLKE